MEDDRVVDLEIKLAYQDKLIRELDTLVRALAARVDEMQRELRSLKEAVGSPETPIGPANDPPPHY